MFFSTNYQKSGTFKKVLLKVLLNVRWFFRFSWKFYNFLESSKTFLKVLKLSRSFLIFLEGSESFLKILEFSRKFQNSLEESRTLLKNPEFSWKF